MSNILSVPGCEIGKIINGHLSRTKFCRNSSITTTISGALRITLFFRDIMVCKEEICAWFKRARGSERIEVLCGLLQLCNPQELRFIGSCVEDLAKKDFVSLREDEIRSNDPSHLRTLSDPDIFDERTRSRLIFSVSLLYSLNTMCAHVIFEILTQIVPKISQEQAHDPDRNSTQLDHIIAEDVVLLFTMAANHPAFTFSERQQLYDLYKCVERLLSGYLLQVRSAQYKQL